MIVLIVWLLCAGISWAIGNSKGRPKAGFWFGLLLGFIGVIVAVSLKPAAELDAMKVNYLDMPKARRNEQS